MDLIAISADMTTKLLAEGQAYGDGWDEGREAMIKEFEAIAFHWEQERKGGAARYREAATWLRNAIRRVRENRPYTDDD